MTIRDVLNQVLAGISPDANVSELMEALGWDDVQPEAFSTALVHFADQAPIEVADGLSPIVTRVSSVPLEPGDLPTSAEADAILADGGGVFELFDELAPTDAELGSLYSDDDPSGFDAGEDVDDGFDDDDLDSSGAAQHEAAQDDGEPADEGNQGDEADYGDGGEPADGEHTTLSDDEAAVTTEETVDPLDIGLDDLGAQDLDDADDPAETEFDDPRPGEIDHSGLDTDDPGELGFDVE